METPIRMCGAHICILERPFMQKHDIASRLSKAKKIDLPNFLNMKPKFNVNTHSEIFIESHEICKQVKNYSGALLQFPMHQKGKAFF